MSLSISLVIFQNRAEFSRYQKNKMYVDLIDAENQIAVVKTSISNLSSLNSHANIYYFPKKITCQ